MTPDAQLWLGVSAIVLPIIGAMIGIYLRFEHRMTKVETLLSMLVMQGAGEEVKAEMLRRLA